MLTQQFFCEKLPVSLILWQSHNIRLTGTRRKVQDTGFIYNRGKICTFLIN